MTTTTDAVAEFGSSIASDDLGNAVRKSAVRALDHVLAGAVAKSDTSVVESIVASLTAMLPEAPDHRGDLAAGLPPVSAALVIGTAASLALDQRATTFERLACVVVPACYVAAQQTDCAGVTLLEAIAIGNEIGMRTAQALGDQHVARGWDLAGSAGRIGATAGVARVLGLSFSQLHNALGFASTMSAGIRVGGEVLSALSGGKAAADALEAATLGKNGLLGPPAPLEGRRGLFALVAPGREPSSLVEGLGQHWQDHIVLAPDAFADIADQLSDAPDISSLVARFSELTRGLEGA